MTFFPTSTPVDATITEWQPSLEQFQAVCKQRDELDRKYTTALSDINDLRIKIANAGGVIMDYYSENGELTDELKEIGNMLGITMTKRISGTANFQISWSAQVPLDFDNDDFEIAFDVDCETYEAEDFEWTEEDTEINAEDDY